MNVTAVINDIMTYIKQEVISELINQGHNHTGSLISSIEVHIAWIGEAIAGQLFMNDYWYYLDKGVSASRIPYRRGSGAKTSKYIDALIKYFKRKGLGLGEAKSASFATANKHKQEGMPTKASYRFSKNNRRTGFVKSAIEDNLNDIYKYAELSAGNEAEKALFNILTRVAA